MTSRIDEIKKRLEAATDDCFGCGGPVKVVGNTTQHNQPAASRDDLAYCLGEIEKRTKLLESLIRKVNLVTAIHRHGNEVPKSYLTELSNRQIEVEHALEAGE